MHPIQIYILTQWTHFIDTHTNEKKEKPLNNRNVKRKKVAIIYCALISLFIRVEHFEAQFSALTFSDYVSCPLGAHQRFYCCLVRTFLCGQLECKVSCLEE